MLKLKTGEVCNIKYTKDSGEISERTIIPTTVPANLRAIDVSDMPDEIQASMGDLVEGYTEYMKNQMKNTFSFEDWISHTLNEDIDVKWRTFKPSGVEVISK